MQIINQSEVEPMTEHDGLYCSTECYFLEITTLCNGICKRDGKALYFYDWYIAHCNDNIDLCQ